ncbi:DUF2584 family protein [Thalassobacillus pellis]|uniref:DUF2584 family protein n=1 Tax=Thalassobacillus pellis TaxID=748008 RepID=UPI001960F3A2|nr:DUF2584 family protein [Thalassobacillus pellis]MBM7552537.1 hypothetical protein [Thalassobacillus pellis]
MPSPFTMEWNLITHGKEKRIDQADNIFEMDFEGYRIFPMGENIEIKRNDKADLIGIGKIVEIIFRDGRTICKYQLISLYSVN